MEIGGLPRRKMPLHSSDSQPQETPPVRRFFKTAARRRAIPPAVPPPFDKGGKTAAKPAANRKNLPAERRLTRWGIHEM